MGSMLSSLTHAIEGTPLVAAGAALLWGVLSIVLSPCHLASIPLVVGFIHGQGRMSTKRAFLIALLFSIGIMITIALVGAVTAMAGRMLGDVGPVGAYVVAAVFFLMGLHLLGVVPMPWSRPDTAKMGGRGLTAAFTLGLVFGMALGPCTFAYAAPMLAVTFRMAGTNPAYGIVLLLLYGIGHCAIIVLAGTFTEAVQHYLNWNERSRGAIILRRACGILVLLAGLYILYKA